MAAQVTRTEVPAEDAAAAMGRRPWTTPRVIVSQLSGTQYNSNITATDHTQFTGSGAGSANS